MINLPVSNIKAVHKMSFLYTGKAVMFLKDSLLYREHKNKYVANKKLQKQDGTAQ